MLIGIPKEIKDNEARVALSPQGVAELCYLGHELYVTKNSGMEIGYSDELYKKSGAKIVTNNEELYKKSDLIVKVKEPQANEVNLFKKGQILFSYLHLAAEEQLTLDLLKQDIIAISYETVSDKYNNLPLLQPMSEVAGRLSVQSGAFALQKNNGGKGLLLGGVAGVAPAKVTIIGGGVSGTNAAFIASGMGADVTILDKSLYRIRELDNIFANQVKVVYASREAIENHVVTADLVIGAVLVPGAKAPKIISKKMVNNMSYGSVIVDISIDQGGCSETSRPTTHTDPLYKVSDISHYCVTNIPAAAAKTATRALENATLPYIIELANKGYKQALSDDVNFANGLNIFRDKVTYKSVADSLSLPFYSPQNLF
jgi:alanine dehydrogenase